MSNTEIALYVLLYYVASRTIGFICYVLSLVYLEQKKQITTKDVKERVAYMFIELLLPVIGDIWSITITVLYTIHVIERLKHKENE